MGYEGINLGNVKLSNRSAILRLLSDRGPTSRKDIAEALGLTPASVTLICSDLIAEGILEEKGEAPEAERRAGRRKVLVGINFAYRNVLTLCIEASDTTIAVCDLAGELKGQKRVPTDVSSRPAEFLRKLADEAKILMWEAATPKESVLGVGVSVPGNVDRASGVSRHAYRVWSEAVDVRELLAAYLELPVVVENNVKSFAVAELVYGAGRVYDDLLFLKWGPGVGSAIIASGEVYDGRDSRAAEIGHIIAQKDGRLCRCGRRGCLETLVSTHAVVRRVRDAYSKEAMPELWAATEGDATRVSAHRLTELLASNDPALWTIVDEVVDELARAAVNAATLTAPQKLVVYGYMFNAPQVKERFLAACSAYDPAFGDDFVLASGLDAKNAYIGPVAVAVNELFLLGAGASS